RNQPAIHGERGRVLCSRHRPDGGGSRHLAGSGGAPFGAVGHLPSRHAGNGAGPPHPGGGKGYGHHHDHGRRGDGNRSGGDPGRGCRFHRQADPDGAISEDPSKLPAAVGKAESLRNHDPAGNRPVVESGNGGHRFPMGGGPGGPQGIDPLTLEKVVSVLRASPPPGMTAEETGQAIGASRSTARRYLEYLVSVGGAVADVSYGSVG